MSWWNPWSWDPVAVERWELRVSGFGRWTLVFITFGAALGFLIGCGVTANNDLQLSRHGAVVTASVEDAAPSGRDTEYLLSFVVDGQSDTQWLTGRGLKVGDTVAVIVDHDNHANLELTTVYGHRWFGYVLLLLGSAAFAGLGVMFVRMDSAGFRRYSRGRYGHV